MSLRKIYLITLLEGFTTLAIQMIVLRLAIPVVGSSIVLTSIFLGVILLALSCGYRYGGILAEKAKPYTNKRDSLTSSEGPRNNQNDQGTVSSIILTKEGSQSSLHLRSILGRRLIVSGGWYLIVVLPWMKDSLQWLIHHIGSIEGALFLIACGFFFVPIFLASQTIPLLTELIPIESKGKSAGTIFFISTIGSFLGSIVTTLVLFPWLGLQMTGILVSLTLIVLGLMSFSFEKFKRTFKQKVFSFIAFIVITPFCILHFAFGIPEILVHNDTPYQEIIVASGERSGKDVRFFLTNRAFASGFDPEMQQSPFHYIRHVVDLTKILQPKSVLVIGAAGFVYPYEIAKFPSVQHIDAIDIDPAVKDIAETYLIQEKISEKIRFIPRSARGAVRKLIADGKHYDMIFVDAFLGKSVPAELVTQEFVSDMKQLSDIIIWNMILDKRLESDFAQRFLSTIQSVTNEVFAYDSIGRENNKETTNMIISTKQFQEFQPFVSHKKNPSLYTDDTSSAEVDSVKILME